MAIQRQPAKAKAHRRNLFRFFDRAKKGVPMKRQKQILSGLCSIAFASLGIYCSVRAFQIHQQLHGQTDFDDSVRDWSSGATACFIACGVIAVLTGKKQEMARQQGGTECQPTIKWWRTTIGITVLLAVCL